MLWLVECERDLFAFSALQKRNVQRHLAGAGNAHPRCIYIIQIPSQAKNKTTHWVVLFLAE